MNLKNDRLPVGEIFKPCHESQVDILSSGKAQLLLALGYFPWEDKRVPCGKQNMISFVR